MTTTLVNWRVDMLSMFLEFRSMVEKIPNPVNTIGIKLIFKGIGDIAALGLKQDDPELFNICNLLGFYNPQHWSDETNEAIVNAFKERGYDYPYPIGE